MGFYRDFGFVVYGILRARDKLLLYVGQTSEAPNKRLLAHICRARRVGLTLNAWERWIVANPAEELEIIPLCSGEGVSLDAHAKEREMIQSLLTAGVRLLNSTNGVSPCLRRREPAYAPLPRRSGLAGVLTVF
jgi:hypothetical protein